MIKINQIVNQMKTIEYVRRLGIGNPNSLCDGIAEAILSSFRDIYLRDYGEIQPCDIKEIRLVGGKTKPQFCGGDIIKPSTIIVIGDVAPCSQDVDDVVMDATIDYLNDVAPHFDVNNVVSCINECGLNPQNVDNRSFKSPSLEYGIGYASGSVLEEMVYMLETDFFNEQREQKYSPIGYDVNINGLHNGKNIDIDINCAMVDEYLTDNYEYESTIEELKDELTKGMCHVMLACDLDYKVNFTINKNCEYLTMMGTFAESKNGNIRRGNGCNGLITPSLPMQNVSGMDSQHSANKNYSVFSTQMSQTFIKEITGLEYIEILMLTEYDKPILETENIIVHYSGDIEEFDLISSISESLLTFDVNDYTTF